LFGVGAWAVVVGVAVGAVAEHVLVLRLAVGEFVTELVLSESDGA
jgi:hypothetical protein